METLDGGASQVWPRLCCDIGPARGVGVLAGAFAGHGLFVKNSWAGRRLVVGCRGGVSCCGLGLAWGVEAFVSGSHRHWLADWFCGFLHNSSWDFLSDIRADRLGISLDRPRRAASQVRPPSRDVLERLRWPSANKKIFPPVLKFLKFFEIFC